MVFLLVLGKGFTKARYQLSSQEQDDLWAQVRKVDRQAGGSLAEIPGSPVTSPHP